MKLLAGNKLLCALLAVVAVGMGVQTYYLVQVQRQLSASEVRTADTAAVPGPAAQTLADPFAELEEAEGRMRSLFDGFYDRFDRDFGGSLFGPRSLLGDGDSFLLGGSGQIGPRVDIEDRGDHYELTMDIPGADETDVVVRAEDDTLIVEGSRQTTTEESQPGSFVRRERQFGRFERRLALPRDADAQTLETAFEKGVLKVTLQKVS